MLTVAAAVGGAISFWLRRQIELYALHWAGRISLHLLPMLLTFLVILLFNIRMIHWFGQEELDQRETAQWGERLRARCEQRAPGLHFEDLLDYLAWFNIASKRLEYRLGMWRWRSEEKDGAALR